jgi:hypothetical protein
MEQMNIMNNAPPLVKVDNPWKSRHNWKATREAIKRMLAGGTPDFIKHPEDYKQFAQESFLAEKERSTKQVAEYRIEDQEELVDFKARNVNIIGTQQFVKKLTDNGVKCFVCYNGLPQTIALWSIVPTEQGLDARYVCFMQTPAMIEWSVLRLDEHGLPAGELYRGWRTVLSQMILKQAITEEKAHKIFGRPTESIVSRRYRRTLYEFRNKRLES